ncbi:keratin, type I cytoskeletal 9-like [Triticum dicoccoides]|uniref:keratin, type I cytoskeletal 9-like n=1 Tax=Triticum dicoccoides TaxID=85692 RepID=UPI00188FF41E|nr:keratin, type I cytoskeletal 9-like [Triticum dicoccoides]
MVMFDLNEPPPVDEVVEDGAGRGGEDGGSWPPPPEALVVGARDRGTADAVVLGGRRPPPLGMAGRPRGGFFYTSGDTTPGLPPLGLVRRPRAVYTPSIGDAASDMPPSGLLGRTMPSFTIGTAGSEPVVPVRRVGLSRRPRGGCTGEAGSSRGGGSNRARGAVRPRGGASSGSAMGGSSVEGSAVQGLYLGDGLEEQNGHRQEHGGGGTGRGGGINLVRGAARPRRPRGGASSGSATGGSSVAGSPAGRDDGDEQVRGGNVGTNNVQAPARTYGRPPRSTRGRGSRKGSGSGTSRTPGVEENGVGIGYAGGFDSNYTFGNFQSAHDAGVFEHMDACPPLPEFPLAPKKILDLSKSCNI